MSYNDAVEAESMLEARGGPVKAVWLFDRAAAAAAFTLSPTRGMQSSGRLRHQEPSGSDAVITRVKTHMWTLVFCPDTLLLV